MLTTQDQISEQIALRLRQFTNDASIDDREIMLSVHQTLGEIVRNRYFESKGMESPEVDGAFYYTINDISVLKNRKGEYYCVMPSTSISLPFGVDIKRVGTDKGIGFVPVQSGFSDLYAGLPSSSLEGKIGYHKSGTNLMFPNMNGSNNPEKINIEMLLPFDNLGEDDQINIPADVIGEVIEIVFSKFTNTLNIPTDEVNNGID